MAVKQAASFTGVTDEEIRIGEPVNMQDVEDIAADQANVYETVTGFAVPDAAAISATPQTHNAVVGEPLPFPLAGDFIGVRMDNMSLGGSGDVFSPMVFAPFFCPAGITKVVFVGTTSKVVTAELLRATVADSSLANISNPQQVSILSDGSAGPGGLHLLYAELETSPGSVNHFLLEGWESSSVPQGDVGSWTLFPFIALGAREVPSWVEPRFASSDVRVPGLTQHSNAHAFTSMDEGFFTDKRSISSWMVQGIALNDALNFELLTGRPAGDLSDTHTNDRRYPGHSHAGGTTLDDCGALIHQPMGSWSYGVARAYSASSGHLTNDMGDSGEYTWSGRIHAPTILSGSSTWHTAHNHMVRLPALDQQHARDSVGGATTKIAGSALVRINDVAKSGTCSVRLTLKDPLGVEADGTAITAAAPLSSGMHVLSFSNLDASHDPGNTGIQQQLQVEVHQTGATFNEFAIYGVCLWTTT